MGGEEKKYIPGLGLHFIFFRNDHHCCLKRSSYERWEAEKKKKRMILHEPVKTGVCVKGIFLKVRVGITSTIRFHIFSRTFFFSSRVHLHFGSSIHIHYKLILGRLRMKSIFLDGRRWERAAQVVRARVRALGDEKIGQSSSGFGEWVNKKMYV